MTDFWIPLWKLKTFCTFLPIYIFLHKILEILVFYIFLLPVNASHLTNLRNVTLDNWKINSKLSIFLIFFPQLIWNLSCLVWGLEATEAYDIAKKYVLTPSIQELTLLRRRWNVNFLDWHWWFWPELDGRNFQWKLF